MRGDIQKIPQAPHAVYHGAWGVMLTGETAVGDYPVEAVQYLVNTAKEAEKYIE